MAEVDDLIRRLAGDAGPVRRLRPPLTRAALWLFAVAILSAVTVATFADAGLFLSRAADTYLLVELIATLLTGVAAIVAAFHLSLPDRSTGWVLLPLPPLAPNSPPSWRITPP